MNLADAIRQAVHDKEYGATHPQATPAEVTPAVRAVEEPVAELAPEPEYVAEAVPTAERPIEEDSMNHDNHPGTTVRLEMFLTPDQLSNLFRAVASSQHAMLTAREAASFLRVPAHTLEVMAAEGEIPGFQIDGRWRFSKNAIEEWLVAQQQAKKEAA